MRKTLAILLVVSWLLTVSAFAAQPGEVTNLRSTTHTVNQWSNNPSITFAWDAVANAVGFSYVLDQQSSTEPDGTTEVGNVISVTVNAPADGEYYFHIRGVGANGELGPVAHLGPFKIDTTPPSPVSNFSAVAGDSQVTLSWVAPGNNDLAKVVIRYQEATGGSCSYPENENAGNLVVEDTSPSPGASASYAHTGLTNGKTYCYAAFACDQAGNCSTRATASATPSSTAIVVSGVNPSSGDNTDSSKQLTITGSGFSGATITRGDVKLGSNTVYVTASSVQVNSDTELVATFDLTQLPAGTYPVCVKGACKSNAFTVTDSTPPTVTLTSPACSGGSVQSTGSVTVTIETNERFATIKYTLDGSDPAAHGQTYSGSFNLSSPGTYELRYAAVDQGNNWSSVGSCTIVISQTTSGGTGGGGSVGTPPSSEEEEEMAGEETEETGGEETGGMEEEVQGDIQEALEQAETPAEMGETVEQVLSQALEEASPEEVDDLAAAAMEAALSRLEESGALEPEGLSVVTESVLKSVLASEKAGAEEKQNAVRTVAQQVLEKVGDDRESVGTVLEDMMRTVLEESPTEDKAEVADEVVAEVMASGKHELLSEVLKPVTEIGLALDLTDELQEHIETAGQEFSVVRPEVAAPLVEGALEKVLNLGLESSPIAGAPVATLVLPEANLSFPVAPLAVRVEPDTEQGIYPVNGGLGLKLVDENHVATVVVPLTPDPAGLAAAFGIAPAPEPGQFSTSDSLFQKMTIDEDTGVLEVELVDGSKLLAYFGWFVEGESANLTLDVDNPFDFSALDLPITDAKYRLFLRYEGGARQAIAPAIARGEGLMKLLEEWGFVVTVNRETGVMRIEYEGWPLCVKANYSVLPLSEAEEAEFEAGALEGFYFAEVDDLNGDGSLDFEIWTEEGKQILWGLSCP